MVPLTGLEPVLSNLRQILSLLCLPFHHSGALFIPHPSSKPQSNTGGSNRRDAEIQEKRNSKSRLIATGFQKGVPNDPSDFKSPVSTDSTTAAANIFYSIISP